MAYGNREYGRWLPDHWAMLSWLLDVRMAFFSDCFTQSITGRPYTCQPLDLWIETTMDINSKLKQGWLQLLQNEKQFFSTIGNANNVARVKAALRKNLSCHNLHRKHDEWQSARMKKDEQAVHELPVCIVEFDPDPFDLSKPTLRSLQSGLFTAPELVTGFQMALKDGKIEAETICMKEYSPNHGLSQQPFTGRREVTLEVSGASINVALMETSWLVAPVDLAEGVSIIKLESALEGRATEECLSIFDVDRSMRKTCKSKLLQLFSMEPDTECHRTILALWTWSWCGD